MSARSSYQVMRAEQLAARGAATEALHALRLAAVYDPESPLIATRVARLAWLTDDPKTKGALKHATRVARGTSAAWRLVGHVYWSRGAFIAARRAFLRSLRGHNAHFDPRVAERAASDLADLLSALGRHDQALAALAGAKGGVHTARARARILEEVGDFRRAVEILEAAYERHRDDPDLVAQLEHVHARYNALERALHRSRAELAARPNDRAALIAALRAEAQGGVRTRARDHERALIGDGDNRLDVATAYWDAERFDDVVRVLQDALETPRAVLLHAAAEISAGRRARAERALSEAQKRWPGNKGLALALARSHVESGRVEEARSVLANWTNDPRAKALLLSTTDEVRKLRLAELESKVEAAPTDARWAERLADAWSREAASSLAPRAARVAAAAGYRRAIILRTKDVVSGVPGAKEALGRVVKKRIRGEIW